MNDVVVGGVGGAAAMAAVARVAYVLWRRFNKLSDSRTDDCKERLSEVNVLLREQREENAQLQRDKDQLRERLFLEMQLGARRAIQPRSPSDPPPVSLEPPPWEEDTGMRDMRMLAEGPVLALERSEFSKALRGRKVLVIDDEEAMGHALARLIPTMLPGWTVSHEVKADVGLSVLLLDEEITLAIVDIRMPHLNGIDLIRDALVQRPELSGRIIICTGAVVSPVQRLALTVELGCHIVDKGNLPEELRRVLARLDLR